MFEKFTDRARRTVVLAEHAARTLDHDYLGNEHVLLGLLEDCVLGQDSGTLNLAGYYLQLHGLDPGQTAVTVKAIVGCGAKPIEPARIPFTPRVKRVLVLADQESLRVGHDYIGTEHVLLGLLREGKGVAAQVLRKNGVALQPSRDALLGVDRSRSYDREVGLPSEQGQRV